MFGRQVTVWPEWRNWQTRRIQNPFPARECGFESHLRYLSDRVGQARGQAATSIADDGYRNSDSFGACNRKGPLMGYVFGMFMVVLMLAIGLGGVFFVFGGSNGSATKDDH